MPNAASSVGKAHAAGAEDAAISGGSVAPIPVAKNRIMRLWRRICSVAIGVMLWLSTLGTLGMLLYQYLYSWGKLPVIFAPDPGAAAWALALAAMFGFFVCKIPHLLGQEPADWVGLVREVYLGLANIAMAVVFLTRVYGGMNHPPNAVGISIFLLMGFLGLGVWQIIWTIKLTARTWTDSTAQSP